MINGQVMFNKTSFVWSSEGELDMSNSINFASFLITHCHEIGHLKRILFQNISE